MRHRQGIVVSIVLMGMILYGCMQKSARLNQTEGVSLTPVNLTPAPSSPAVEILSHQSNVDNEWLSIVGEVRNNTGDPMEFVKVVATLYDKNNQVVGTNYAYTALDIIPPNGKSPFSIEAKQPLNFDHYDIQVQGR